MKTVFATLLLALCLLTACGGPAQAPATTPEEKPLFTDADIDKAQLITASELKELMGIEGGMAPAGQDIAALPDNQGELSAQGTLPNTNGFVYYLRHNRLLVDVPPYSVFRHWILDGTLELLYSGEREIQSVAGDHHNAGNDNYTDWVVMSMRETTDPASDFEIFFVPRPDYSNPTIYLLTNDNVDNTNVSTSFSNYYSNVVIAYEQPVAGKATLVLRRGRCCGFPSFDTYYLIYPDSQRQPSISQDGQYLTFVRDLSNGIDEIVRYTVATNTYLSIATSRAVLEYPSISWDGQKVMWLENGQNGYRDVVRLKDLSTGTTQIVIREPVIAHPFLTANGLYMTYQTTGKIVARDLSTGQNADVATTPVANISLYGPTWAQKTYGKLVLQRGPAASLQPHVVLCFLFSGAMFPDTVERAFTLRVNGQARAWEVGLSYYQFCFLPSPPLESGDVVSWSFSSEARSVDGQRLDPVAGSSVVNAPPDGELQIYINGASTKARVRVRGPHGFDSGNLSSDTLLTGLLQDTYTISAQGYYIGVPGTQFCRIYTPNFYSRTIEVRYDFTGPITVYYTSKPCS